MSHTQLHPWWTAFGRAVAATDDLTPALARELASLGVDRRLPGITVTGLRGSADDGYVGVAMDVEVERPQDLEYPIRALEPIAVLCPLDGGQPSVLALRDDFPDTFHQNWSPPDAPCALCIDDRPWAEARLTATANDIAGRIQLWLSKAARGALHDAAQPPDPLFFTSQLSVVLAGSAVFGASQPVELTGFVRHDNEHFVIAREAKVSQTPPTFTLLVFQARPREMARLRHAPRTLAALAQDLEPCDIDLYSELKCRLKSWAGLDGVNIRRLSTRLAVVVVFPIVAGQHVTASDVRAFITVDTAGELGVALGTLHRNDSQVGDGRAYVAAIIPQPQTRSQDLRLQPANVYLALNRQTAAAVAGRTALDLRPAVLVGAGSLGSQLSLNLAREGLFNWTVVDGDHLLPHNCARHALFPEDIGSPKADALARKLRELLDEPVASIQCDVLHPDERAREALTPALADAAVIIDASASVAVSRHLSDVEAVEARRICAFFNPAGTAVVVLAENARRTLTLRDLEAQYYSIVCSDPRLAGHLDTPRQGLRYSGSCRALTNRIPASNAALLAALAARGTVKALATDQATIAVWVLDPDGEVQLVRRQGASVTRKRLGEWTVAYDTALLRDLASLRTGRLPKETGGVLLGVADMSHKEIYIASALPEPEDSCASETGFERGVVNLRQQVAHAVARTAHQLRYVGEWHSHPDQASPMPSETDMEQLEWLGQELEMEGLPGLMAVVAQEGGFTIGVNASRATHKNNNRGDAPR